ncbi:unnamed protein product, partial [Linum tenue]
GPCRALLADLSGSSQKKTCRRVANSFFSFFLAVATSSGTPPGATTASTRFSPLL